MLASNRPEDQALIDPANYRHPADIETLLSGVEMAKAIAQQDEMVQWGSRGLVQANRYRQPDKVVGWIKRATMTTFHFCGSCAMGEAAEHPVDTQLRVKGVTGLRVADASVIPYIPVSAINAPSMMIGWRVADFILQQAKAEQQQKRSKTASTNNSKREAAEG